MEKFKVNYSVTGIILIVAVCLMFVLISGFAIASEKTGKTPNSTLEVCSTAKITTIEYFMKESAFSGGPKLHVKVGITNISDKPLRYRVSIFLPDGASSGGFYPRKGSPPVVKPGEENVETLPVYYDKIPDAITIKVDEL